MTAPAGHEPIALEPQPTFRDHNFTYRIEFLEHPPVVAVTTSEHVNLSGWARLHEELLADPRVKELPLLLDHSKLDATFLHSDSVRMMGKIASDIDKELQPPRRAIVIAGGFQLGPDTEKSRAVGRRCRCREVRDFRSRGAALDWLVE